MVKMGAFKGATAWEAYIGRLWITILLPSYWPYAKQLRGLIRIGWGR